MTEERKLVTVLFADIVGSTELGASHDPEVVRRTLSRVFNELRQALEVHGGTVEKFIGDAVFAVFGIPQTHDDDADRAVRAAFALRHRIDALNANGRLALELRVGVNSGRVVTGESGETLVTGDAVNEAARLQTAAVPGEILVGALTRQLTKAGVRYGAAREFDAKGVGRMTAWPAEELASALPAQHRGIPGRRAPLIGRDDELRLLVQSYRNLAVERRAVLVTIFGNTGIGKSRLVDEFIEAIAPDRVLRGRCLPYGEGITFWPVVEILHSDAGIDAADSQQDAARKLRASVLAAFGGSSEDAEAVARRLTVFAGIASRDDALPDVPAENMPAELRWGLRRYLERGAAERPLTVVFDDIHWAEPALLDLIEHLAEWARAPLFVLCLARPDLRELRPAWGGGLMNASAIKLDPLTRDESTRLIRDLLADGPPDEVAEALISRSEGNPLYLEEFLRMLIDGGHLIERDGRFVASGPISTLVLPPTLQGLIAARLDGLPSPVKLLVQRAAVVGKVFWPEAIASLGSIAGRLEDLLIEAARRDLVTELDEPGLGGGRSWTFRHILVRDVAYDAIPKAERSRAHAAFGDWLEATAGARREEYADIIAYHFEQAFLFGHELGEPDLERFGRSAYRDLMAGGMKARQRGDIRVARRFAERALAVAAGMDLPIIDQQSTRGWVALARWQLDGSVDSLAELAAVAAELRRLSPTIVLVEILQALSEQLSDSDATAATTLGQEAVDIARSFGDPEVIARAMVGLQWGPWATGDLESQRRILVDADVYIEASGVYGARGRALGGLRNNAFQRGAFNEMVAYAGRQHEWASANGSPIQRADALHSLAQPARMRGDFGAALELARRSIELAVDGGLRESIGTYQWAVAEALVASGDLAGAEAALEASVKALEGAAFQGVRAESRAKLARTLVASGKLEEARRQAELARAEVGADDFFTITTATWALAMICAAEGRVEEADRLYRDARGRIGRTGYRVLTMDIQREHARFLIATGRSADARPLLDEVRVFYDTPETPVDRERTDALLKQCEPVEH